MLLELFVILYFFAFTLVLIYSRAYRTFLMQRVSYNKEELI